MKDTELQKYKSALSSLEKTYVSEKEELTNMKASLLNLEAE